MKDSIKVHDYTTTRSLAQSRSKNILLGTCKVGLDSVPIPEFGLNHNPFFDPFPSSFRVLVPSPEEVHYKKIHKHQHTLDRFGSTVFKAVFEQTDLEDAYPEKDTDVLQPPPPHQPIYVKRSQERGSLWGSYNQLVESLPTWSSTSVSGSSNDSGVSISIV